MRDNLISIESGFQTSINIAYDLNNTGKIKGLIPTLSAIERDHVSGQHAAKAILLDRLHLPRNPRNAVIGGLGIWFRLFPRSSQRGYRGERPHRRRNRPAAFPQNQHRRITLEKSRGRFSPAFFAE